MKRFKTIALVAACLLFAGKMEMSAQGFDRPATEVITDMAPGWNLGNTFEAVADWMGGALWNNGGGLAMETGWQDTKMVAMALRALWNSFLIMAYCRP